MAKNYKVCNITCTTGGEVTKVITLTQSSPYTIQNGNQNNSYIQELGIDLTATLDSVAACDIVFNVIQDVYFETSNGVSQVFQDTLIITIPAGQLSGLLSVISYYESIEFNSGGGGRDEFDHSEYREEYTYTYSEGDQTVLPTCGQSLSCTLDITGTTIVAPSFAGLSDGSITILYSGDTNTLSFRLNGGTPQGSAVFTGLPAGIYQLRIDEAVTGCYAVATVDIPTGAFQTGAFNVVEPNSILASENPIVLTLSTALNDVNSLPAIMRLTVGSGITDNYNIRFSLTVPTEYNIQYNSKEFPNRITYFLANKLRDSAGLLVKTNSNNEIAASLAQVLQSDIILSTSYFINQNNNTIELVSKINSKRFTILNGVNYNAYRPNNTLTSTGVTLTVVQQGTDNFEGAILEDYSLYAEVYGSKNDIQYGSTLNVNDFNRITEVQLPYQTNNIHVFNFNQVCKSFVSTPKPDYEFTGFTTVSTYLQPFYFKYGEFYPLIQNTNTKKKKYKGQTGYKWVANAALNYEAANNMSAYTGITSGGFLRDIPYLTNAPLKKQTSKRQRELLYFIVPKDLGQGVIDVRGSVTFWDGSVLPIQVFTTISTNAFNFGGAFLINVSFDNLGLPAIENTYNKLIKQLDIAVYTGGVRNLTVNKTYVYDLEERVNRIGISWLNKLGTFDTFDFSGLSEDAIDRTSKEYTILKNINADGSLASGYKSKTNYDVEVTKKVKVNTGWINASTFNWLLELLNSNDVYIYTTTVDNSVRITGFKYSKSSNDTLYNVELELTNTAGENNVSI
jgi:hypothetical protein